MKKQYVAIYNCKDYNLQDIKNMVEPYRIRYWHRDQTWDTPEEESIDYKIEISSDFDKVVKIACIEFENSNDDHGQYVHFNEMHLRLCQKGYDWLDLLRSFGWDTFNDVAALEDFQNSELAVRLNLDEWINNIAETRAWEIINNE